MQEKSVVFSETMEKKFLTLAAKEGVFSIPDGFKLKETIKTQTVTRDDKSLILANLFLNPYIKLRIVYEINFEPKIDNLFIKMQNRENRNHEFKDYFTLCSLILARNPTLTLELIGDDLDEFLILKNKVIESFGSVPTRQLNGDILTLGQAIMRPLDKSECKFASNEQQLLFSKYEIAKQKAQPIISIYKELEDLNRRKNTGDSVVIDPKIKKSFTDFLDDNIKENDVSDEIDLFYLFIKELRTLPVGKNIKETIELSNTKQGESLRMRINELHDLILADQLRGIDSIQKKIRNDIHEYKLLTNKLITPNHLSDITDLTLSGTSLIPMIGTFTGIASLAITADNISQKRRIYKKIQDSIWVGYEGDTY